MKYTIQKILEFDYGHRIVGHESKCAYLHGHRGKAIVKISTEVLDNLWRVIDFGVVKMVIGDWINENWDHNMILSRKDPLYRMWENSDETHRKHLFGDKTPFWIDENPTAEALARLLFETCVRLFSEDSPIEVSQVEFWETPNSCAIYPSPL